MSARFRAIPLLAVFGLVSLAAVLAGLAICSAGGVPLTVGLRDIAAWAIGAVVAAIIALKVRRSALPVFLWLLPVGLLAGFLNPGIEGVHRWLALGPVQANVVMLLGPAFVVAFAARMDFWPTGSWLAILAALALTATQPDASQAAGLAAVAVLAAWSFHARPRSRLILVALAIGAAVWAWQRPDPLAPVPEVEGVIGLAFAQSVSMGALALSLLILTAVAPSLAATSPAARLPALSLALFLLAWAAAPFLGAFPVPFLGMGPSPIVGAWLGVGLLAALLRTQAAATAA